MHNDISLHYIILNYSITLQTPLHLAALTNEAEMCELLLSQNADLDLADRHGNTPVHIAAMAGYERLLSILLSRPRSEYQWPRPFPNIDRLNFDGKIVKCSLVPLKLIDRSHIFCLFFLQSRMRSIFLTC